VDEMEIARTMLLILERNKLLVEGSGASPLAAMLYDKMNISSKKVAAVLSGGNVDVNFISRIIERGLVESGRFAHFTINIKDKPGELQRVLSLVTDLNANVQFVNLHRIGKHIYPGNALLEISVETKDHAHIEQLYKNLRGQGFQLKIEE